MVYREIRTQFHSFTHVHEAARRVALGLLRQDFHQLRFPDGLPNLEPTASVRITDKSPIVRLAVPG